MDGGGVGCIGETRAALSVHRDDLRARLPWHGNCNFQHMNTLTAETTRQLRSGNRMPLLGLGTWQLKRDTAASVAHAIEIGFRMIDTSGDYGTQPGVGAAIRASGAQREGLYVVTKVEEDEDAYAAARRNLAEMQLEYVDLLLIHRPPDAGVGEELWRGLLRARDEGLARDIGVSNYSIEQIKRLYDGSGVRPALNQVEWTPFGWSHEMLDFCGTEGIVVQAYSPLTRGSRLDDDRLADLADNYGRTPAQLLLRWNLQHGVVPIPKANKREHLAENIEIFDFEISDGDMAELDNMNMLASSLGERITYAV
jgi:2,5-diketo-D-gluconate reductase A